MVTWTSAGESQRPAHAARSHLSRRWSNRAARRFAGAMVLVCVLFLVFLQTSAFAATEYVDGISDQSLPAWDSGFSGSYFAGFFGNTWINGGHIRLARYVVQWNVMTAPEEEYPHYRERFIKWVEDAGGMGLTLDVSLSAYPNTKQVTVRPQSSSEYEQQLKDILNEAKTLGHPARYIEAWNEPNNQGGYDKASEAATPAHFTNSAYAACEEGYGCTIVAGNVEDNSGAKAYEEEYRKSLSPVPAVWGIHPYYSVEEMNESYYTKAVEGMPNGGTGDQVWITEVAARKCTSTKNNEEAGQAERAKWLVHSLIHNRKPEHVFYYEFMLGEHKQPSCSEFDDALYVPSSDPNAEDRPRPAAAWIFGNTGKPWGYTGGTGAVYKRYAYLEGSVYPGDVLDTKYDFQYGTAPGSKGSTVQADAGNGIEYTGADMGVEGLAPDTTYYYRIVAANAEGEDAGVEKTFTTEAAPPSAKTEGPSGITRTSATLSGQVYPDGLPTEYYFEYSEVGGSEAHTEHVSAGGDESWHSEANTVTGLKSCSKYQFQIYAANADPPSPVSGGVHEFETECWPPEGKTLEASEVRRRSATLDGEIYPNGLPTSYWFEYGKIGSFEAKTSPAEAGSGRSWLGKGASVAGLEPCHAYQFRVVAENEDSHNGPAKGAVYGETRDFETKCKPVIRGVKASHVNPTSVVLEAEIDPEEAETTYHFEYDTREYKQGEAAHGNDVPVPSASIGAGNGYVKVSAVVVNLTEGQDYYFNTVASNESGASTLEAAFKTPVDWELSGKPVASAKAIKGEGALIVQGRGGFGVATVECAVKEEGKAATLGEGEITKVTGTAGESVMSCGYVGKSGESTECEGTTMQVEAAGLPWKTELVNEPVRNAKGEVVRYEQRSRVYGSGAGLVLKCDVGKKLVSASCLGEVSGNVENIASGVPVEFDAKSPRLKCGSTEGSGVVEGAIVLTGVEGTLSISGASAGPLPPVAVTGTASAVHTTEATLHGTVAAKGVAAKYRFEYGPTTGYGSSVPVPEGSAGEGRTRVEVTQTVKGLSASQLYHYRLVATSSAGTSYGEDKTFTPGYPALWDLGGAEDGYSTVKSEGTLVLRERGGYGATVECSVVESGWVSEEEGEVKTVAGSKGEASIPCHIASGGEECGSAEVEATDLPWYSQLLDEPVKNAQGEVLRYEARDRFYKLGGPGWVLKCSANTKHPQTCVGESSVKLENVSAGVPFEFDAKSGSLTCSGDGSGTTTVEGALLTAPTEGTKVLSVSGASAGPLPPVAVTGTASAVHTTEATLHGTVAAKGVETTYRFEYGPTTAYGSSVPVPAASAGSGRTRVEVTQLLTGLETSQLYHYRLAATNSAGTSYGEDKTFTPGYPATWDLNGKQTEYAPIKSEGTLILEEHGGLQVTAECTIVESGEVEDAWGTITKITGVGGGTLTCHAIKHGWCGEATIEAEPAELPWNTELIGEAVTNEKGEQHEEVRQRYYRHTGSEPEWLLKCGIFESTASEACTGETSGNVENVSAGVPIEFDAKATPLTCTGSGLGTLAIEGALLSTSTKGTLTASGAKTGPLPPTVAAREATSIESTGATLNGTVAAKGIATTYQFEYGTTTSYGTKAPATEAKAGEGRTRIEAAQPITGLKANTLYHYRLTAKNSAGTSHTEDKTLTTS